MSFRLMARSITAGERLLPR